MGVKVEAVVIPEELDGIIGRWVASTTNRQYDR